MKNHSILWADDDPDDLQLIREIVQGLNQNLTIIEVHNGQEALDYLQTNTQKGFPHLIILDVNMPVLDGKKTLCHLKENEKFNEIPVVAFTTSDNEMDRMFFRRYGVEVITKPAQYESLRRVVEELIFLYSGINRLG